MQAVRSPTRRAAPSLLPQCFPAAVTAHRRTSLITQPEGKVLHLPVLVFQPLCQVLPDFHRKAVIVELVNLLQKLGIELL